MNREDMRSRLARHTGPWDFVIVDGGATGVGIAVDAASRGYDVLLFEQSDFGRGTSSRSTKLVHGGVRYLERGQTEVEEHPRAGGIIAEHFDDELGGCCRKPVHPALSVPRAGR